MSDTIRCARCGAEEPRLEKPPLRNELGQRVHESIGRECWDRWLKFQTALINHYGLDVRDREAKDFLMQQMEAFFFKAGENEEIDTSKQGSVEW